MQRPRYSFLAAAALLGTLVVGTANAADPRVPQGGSAQGEIVPNALPGGGPAHVQLPEGHLIAPSGVVPQGSAQGLVPLNAVPGATGLSGEARPHSDVTSPAGVVPNSAEGAPRSFHSR